MSGNSKQRRNKKRVHLKKEHKAKLKLQKNN